MVDFDDTIASKIICEIIDHSWSKEDYELEQHGFDFIVDNFEKMGGLWEKLIRGGSVDEYEILKNSIREFFNRKKSKTLKKIAMRVARIVENGK